MKPIAMILMTSLFAPALPAASLDITVKHIDAQGGRVHIAVYDSEAAWNEDGKPVHSHQLPPDGDRELLFRVDNLRPGRYAVRVMHDENGNGKLDTNFLGIPKEGYGASNNPKVMRAPYFNEAAFEVATDDQAIAIGLN